MIVLPRLVVVCAAMMVAAGLCSCKAVSRTIGTSGARDVTPQAFVDYYEQTKRSDVYWVYIGKVGQHYYMEYYRTIDKTYPEFAGEVRVPVAEMPANFPAGPQGVHHAGYVFPEPPTKDGAEDAVVQ